MQEDKIAKEIKAVVAKVIKIPEDKIDPNTNLFTELGVDSLLGVEIFATLDKKYSLDVPESKLKDVNTINDIIALVKSMLNK